MDNKFKLSVIVPVYNAEAYLDETLSCVLGQTIGFKDNIQLILVNDGSPDNSGDICRRYQEQYPDNVIYVEKKNGGVSSARNAGLEYAVGKYTVFLDSDDLWEPDAFSRIYDFFEAHPDEFNACSCRIRFIGDYEGREHPLDYKFENGARVVDLKEEPDIISSTIGNVVVRTGALNGLRFNEKISAGEDSLFVNSILLGDPHLGILPDAVFCYRRNYSGGSGSSSAPNKVTWYTQVPKEYYLGLCKKSQEMHGEVLPFIQYVIMYDLRWRNYNEHMMTVLTEEEKQQHIDIMKEVMSNVTNRVIRKAKGMTQLKKLYLYELKHGCNVTSKAEIKDNWLVYKKAKLFNFRIPTVMNISVFEIENDELLIEGITRISAIGGDYSIVVRDDAGNTYEAKTEPYEKRDVRGFAGEMVARGESFKARVPVKAGMSLSFIVRTRGEEVQLRPGFDKYLGIRSKVSNDYCFRGGYIIRYEEGVVTFTKDNIKNRLLAEAALKKELKNLGDPDFEELHDHEMNMHKIMSSAKTGDKVVFVSCRADDQLRDNMQLVYDKLKLPKAFSSKLDLYRDHQSREHTAALISSAKVIVTDDYMFLSDNYRLRKDQHMVQLWHATGAFKQFGKDSGSLYPGKDRLYHRDYDLVTVSAEGIRQIYADCFQIPVSRVKATGVARTDELFDEEHKQKVLEEVYEKHLELKNRQIILYAPTFRDNDGTDRSVFTPDLDFAALSESLRDDQVMVLCPHPLMTEKIIRDQLDNVIEVRDIKTVDMLIASDVLVTDYSSVMFEAALLGKPIAFYCYDFDTYERDFYLDMDKELPGPVLRTQNELTEYLSGSHTTGESYAEFCKKYLGACDGHSTDRIVAMINDLYNDKEI